MRKNEGFTSDEERIEKVPFPDEDDEGAPTLSDEEVDAQWKRFVEDTRMRRERRMFVIACLIPAAMIAIIVSLAAYMHVLRSSDREHIAAAKELRAAFNAHNVPLAVHAAGPRCDVLLINSVDSQGRMAMLLDDDVDNIFYGGEHWESVLGGVYRYRRDNHFAGVLFVESGGDAWVDGTVAPGVSEPCGVSKVKAEKMPLIEKVEAC